MIEEPEKLSQGAPQFPLVFGALIFGFGLAAGFLLAFSNAGLENSAAVIISLFMGIIFALLILGGVLFLFRKVLLDRAFGVVHANLEQVAGPLSRVAQGAAERDPTGTIAAGRELLNVTLARYAWMSTRRWLIASLTGLIAAMAALAGTALLFKQNEHLEDQLVAMKLQNERILDQSVLLATQVELAEAARNAEIAVEITNIAGLLGEALERKVAANRAAGVPPPSDAWAGLVPELDPLTDISQSLRMRIVAASRAAKPYRFLEPQYLAHDDAHKLSIAMRRRPELLVQNDALGALVDGEAEVTAQTLINRPASPERAQLLHTLIQSGLRDLESFSFFGMDLSFAAAEDLVFPAISLQNARLSYASFARSDLIEVQLGGAWLNNASFAGARVKDSVFDLLPGEEAKGAYAAPGEVYTTQASGVSFADAFVINSSLRGANALFADFDGATLAGVAFDGALLSGATFRDAVILAAQFDGADLKSVDFDGAFVTSPDFLSNLSAVAAPETFKASRFTLAEVPAAELAEALATQAQGMADQVMTLLPDGRAWRITRVGAFGE